MAAINPLDQMRATRDVSDAEGDLDDLPDPLAVAPDEELPSTVLARLRREER